MAYTPYYSGGWQSGEEGGTPITPDALNHMDDGIDEATAFHVGDTFNFGSAQILFRTLNDKSAIFFRYNLPKQVGDDVTSFSVVVTTGSTTWFSNGSAGSIAAGTNATNINIISRRVLQFAFQTSATPLANTGFGIAELTATVTFT